MKFKLSDGDVYEDVGDPRENRLVLKGRATGHPMFPFVFKPGPGLKGDHDALVKGAVAFLNELQEETGFPPFKLHGGSARAGYTFKL